MKNFLKIIFLLAITLVLFRNFVYRSLVKYSDIGSRIEVPIVNEKLIKTIEAKTSNRSIGLEQIAEIANDITKEQLKFTAKQKSNNPNELINIGRANCVGYSTMFNSVANYLIRKNQLQSEIKAEHKIGHLTFLGINVHSYFEGSFFKDHDFNEIHNTRTDKSIAIDPSLSDYFWINEVAKSID